MNNPIVNPKLYELLKHIETRAEIGNEDNPKICGWIPFDKLQEFSEIMGNSFFEDGGVEAVILSETIWIDLLPVFEWLDHNYGDYFEVLSVEY